MKRCAQAPAHGEALTHGGLGNPPRWSATSDPQNRSPSALLHTLGLAPNEAIGVMGKGAHTNGQGADDAAHGSRGINDGVGTPSSNCAAPVGFLNREDHGRVPRGLGRGTNQSSRVYRRW